MTDTPLTEAERLVPAAATSAAATAGTRHQPVRRTTVNVRLLLISAGLLLVLLPAGYFWYRHQLKQTAAAFLTRAQQLETDGDNLQATTYYQRYLAVYPKDTEVLVKLVMAYAAGEPTPNRMDRLTNLLYQALGRVPEHDELRLMLAENLLKVGDYLNARRQAEELLPLATNRPEDAADAGTDDRQRQLERQRPEGLPVAAEDARTARRIAAIASFELQADTDDAHRTETLDQLLAAAAESPSEVELIDLTSRALRTYPQAVQRPNADPLSLADQMMDRLVAADPDRVAARLARYRYRVEYGLPNAAEDLQAALTTEADNVEVLLLAAVAVAVRSDRDDPEAARVEEHLRRAIRLAPQDPRAYQLLAAWLTQQGNTDEARKLLEMGWKATNEDPSLGLALAHAQIDANDLSAAAKSIGQLDAQSATYLARRDADARGQWERRLQVLKGRLLVAQDDAQAAIPILQAVVLASEAGEPGQRAPEWVQAMNLLARIYMRQEAWDQASETWDLLARTQPGELEVVLPTVTAHLQARRFQAALDRIETFGQQSQGTSLPAALLVRQAQARLGLQAELSAGQRDWTEFKAALAAAKAADPDSLELLFAEIDYLAIGEADPAAAALLLRSAEPRHIEEVDFWRTAALAYQALEQPDDAERSLARHRALATSPVDDVRLLAQVRARQGALEQADAELKELASALTGNDRRQTEQLRAQLFIAAQKYTEALARVQPLITGDTTNEDLLKLGIEIAIAADDLPTAKAWEDRLRTLTDNGQDARYLRARRLLVEAARDQASNTPDPSDAARQLRVDRLEELDQLITRLRSELPNSPTVLTLAGGFARLQGDDRQALNDYEQAVRRGDRSPDTRLRLAQLLIAASRADEAEAILNQLTSEQRTTTPILDSMAIEIAFQRDRLADALSLAEAGAKEDPDNPDRQLFLATVLFRSGDPSEGLRVLRSAAERFPDDQRIWSSLVTSLIRSRQTDEVSQVLANLASRPRLSPELRSAVVADGYERLGALDAALQQYQLAHDQKPSSADLHLQFAQALAQRDPRAARGEFEELLQRHPDNGGAKRELAILLAATGEEADSARAETLLASASEQLVDERLKALLLSRKGRTRAERRANSQQARMLLQPGIDSEDATESDVNRLLAAQILEQEADLCDDPVERSERLQAAESQLHAVVDGGRPNVAQRLSQYIEFLLRHGRAAAPEETDTESMSPREVEELKAMKDQFLAAAEGRLLALRRLVPSTGERLDVLHASLTAALLQARGEDEAARAHIADFIQSQPPVPADLNEQARRWLANGQLFSTIGAHADAEAWYRRLLEIAPNAYVLVAQSLVEQGRRADAARFCLELAGDTPDDQMANILANIMTTTTNEPEQGDELAALQPEVDAALAAALQDGRDNPALLQAEAVMRFSRGEVDAAIDLFRRILKTDPNNALALNNLATLLAERSDQLTEALETIERAIEISGRQASLLDTQGTILLKQGNVDGAVACLEEATAGNATDARYYLHLAAAYLRAQPSRPADARRMLAEARAFGLERFVLTADDRDLLTQLEAALGLVDQAAW